MASLQNPLIILPSISLLLLISQSHLCLSTDLVPDVHDLLPQYGFPKGLIPNAVKSYTLSSDGSFVIELERSCYVQFDELVYYDKKIKGKLSYGSVSGVSGIQAKQFFLWVSVTGIDINFDSGMIEFYVGPLSKKLPADQFQTVPRCQNKGYTDSGFDSI